MKLRNLSVKNKLLIMVATAVFMIIATCTYNLNEQRKASYSEREGKLSAQVEATTNLVKYFYSKRVELGEEQAQILALEAINNLRYDTTNYFWVVSPELNILLHPIKPELNGENVRNNVDGAGKHHWREMATIARTTSKGFLDYQWKRPSGELQDKISYVEYFPEWGWIIGSGILVADIQEAFYDNAIKEAVVAILMAAMLLLLGFVISTNIVTPLERLIGNTHKIADGDLTVRLNFKRKDELGEMGSEIDRMLDKLQSTLLAANESATQSSDMATNIASASEEAATSVNSQYSQLEQLSTAMTEMSATISDVAHNAESTAHSTDTVVAHAQTSRENMVMTSDTISEVSDNIATADKLVTELKSGVDEISAVVHVINDVSEQTNLLALNAAIEAARAGEQGRGFAVVADEVRSLASRTQKSTAEVQNTIDALIEQTGNTARSMQASHRKVEDSVLKAQETQNQLSLMVEELMTSSDRVSQIAAASEQQGTVAQEVNHNVSSIHLSANEVKHASQMLAEESQSMAEASEVLKDQLRYFKV